MSKCAMRKYAEQAIERAKIMDRRQEALDKFKRHEIKSTEAKAIINECDAELKRLKKQRNAKKP